MFERMTEGAERAWALAQEEARRLGHSYVGPEHLLLGLLSEGRGMAARVLQSVGVSLDAARSQLIRLINEGVLPPSRPDDGELLAELGIDLDEVRRNVNESFGQETVSRTTWRVIRHRWRDGAAWTPLCGLPVAPRTKRVMEFAREEAHVLGNKLVNTEHVLLGLIRDGLEPFRNRRNRRTKRIAVLRALPRDDNVAARIALEAIGVDLKTLHASLSEEIRRTG